MDYNIIASGSSGNAVVINDYILIDCGVSFKALQPFYKKFKIVFISHGHVDHFNKSTIRKLAAERPALRFACGQWLVADLVKTGVRIENIDVLDVNLKYDYNIFKVKIFNVPHNVQNCGFKFYFKNEKLFYCTDCNSLEHIQAKDYDLYMIEGNYKESEIQERIAEKKANGQFIYEFDVQKNHLSEEKALAWLVKNAGATSQYILLHKHKEE